MKSKKVLLGIGLVAVMVALAGVGGMVYAAFMDNTEFKGATIYVGTSDIVLLNDLAKGNTADNLVEELPAPILTGVNPNWSQDYLLKIYSKANTPVNLFTEATYTTAEDPEDLRRYVMVEVFNWSDTNWDGILEEGELGQSYGIKNIIDWKMDGIDMGNSETNTITGYVFRFTAPEITNDKQGKTGKFDFSITSTGL